MNIKITFAGREIAPMPEPFIDTNTSELSHSSSSPLAQEQNPWKLMIVTLTVVMIGFQFIGSFFGLLVALPFYDGSIMDFVQDLQNPTGNPDMRVPLLIMQGVASITGFLAMPWVLMKFYFRSSHSAFPKSQVVPGAIFATILIVPVFMGFNAPFIEWNQNFVFPEFLSGLESKLKAMEVMLQETSVFITSFDSIGQLLLGLVVVAVIPGIGEELVFRGLIQNNLLRITNNIHVAIWLAALLFSLFHLQFYGLIPRMFLGALFGYLYYFSGSLLYPMIAHFINNGFTLIMFYLYNIGMISFDIESTESLPWTQTLISAVVTVILFLAFKQSFNQTSFNEKLG
jgi:membrane protease YdiL (CAAX protease family)